MATISEQLNEIDLREFGERGVDTLNLISLKRKLNYNHRLARAVASRIPELSAHPFFRFPTVDLETFSSAFPQVGLDKKLVFHHASYVDTGATGHSGTGLAAFHPELMVNLGSEFPGVELHYRFPDDPYAISYDIRFKLFLFDVSIGIDTGSAASADFQSDASDWSDTIISRSTHFDVPDPGADDENCSYINIKVRANAVNGKMMKFRISHVDWAGSQINWWFLSVKLSRTYTRFLRQVE